MKIRDEIVVLLVFMLSSFCHCGDHFEETLFGVVGGGNYTYYWLPQPGTVTLQLNSLEGDADLYISSKNLKPTFDVENHELQSTTCGLEQIKVPSFYERPLSIAVYGHPSHDMSLYELKIDIYESAEETNFPNEVHESSKPLSRPASSPNLPEKDEPEYEERSVFWTLFLHVLQVLLDLLVD